MCILDLITVEDIRLESRQPVVSVTFCLRGRVGFAAKGMHDVGTSKEKLYSNAELLYVYLKVSSFHISCIQRKDRSSSSTTSS